MRKLGLVAALVVIGIAASAWWAAASAAAAAAGSVPAPKAHYTVDVVFTSVEPAPRGSGLVLNYQATVRSIEVPAFHQVVHAPVFLGHNDAIGGIEDWGLFRDLERLPARQRVAFLRYEAAAGSPFINYLSDVVLDHNSSEWFKADTPARQALIDAAASHGLSAKQLLLVLEGDRFQVLGFDATSGAYSLIATREPADSGPIVAE